MNYTEPFLRKVETAQEEEEQQQQHQHQLGVSYRAAVAAKNCHSIALHWSPLTQAATYSMLALLIFWNTCSVKCICLT